jgi:hypothetical protein
VIVSPSETRAVSKSFFDTASVVVACDVDDAPRAARAREIVASELVTLVSEALFEAKTDVCAEAVATGVSRLLSSTTSDDELGLWNRVVPVMERAARSGPERARKNLARFLTELKRPSPKRVQRSRGVRFTEESTPSEQS